MCVVLLLTVDCTSFLENLACTLAEGQFHILINCIFCFQDTPGCPRGDLHVADCKSMLSELIIASTLVVNGLAVLNFKL